MARLDRAEAACLVVAACIAGAELLLWVLPALRPIGPPGWTAMVGNTAAAMLLAAASAWLLGEFRQPIRAVRWIGMSAAVLLIIIGLLFLIEYGFAVSFGIDRLFYFKVPGAIPRFPGRSAPQTAFGFVLLGASLLLVRARLGGWGSKITDAVVISLLGFVLVLCGGYMYRAVPLIGVDPSNMTSLQAVGCFGLLTFILVARRARIGGPFRMLLCIGIGGKAVRVVLPGVFLFPFLIFTGVGYLIEFGLPIPFAQAFASAACALAGLFVVVWLALRINALESVLRGMALSDELTGILNRRGFELLAEQTLREARRDGGAVTVLFIDLDKLKETNDRFGHDVGDQFIADVANLLRHHFRNEDVVARIGGDEFAVLMHGEEWKRAMERMDTAAEALNRSGERPYRIHYSVGEAVYDPACEESLERVMARADANMYADKLARKAANLTEAGSEGRESAVAR